MSDDRPFITVRVVGERETRRAFRGSPVYYALAHLPVGTVAWVTGIPYERVTP